MRFEALLRHDVGSLHLVIDLPALVTVIRDVLLKLGDRIFVALVHPAPPTSDLPLLARLLTEGLRHVL